MDDVFRAFLPPYIFVIGMIVGSFLNVCIYRFPIGKTVVKGRSECMSCGQMIAWYDNIPVISFLFLRGKCRHCGARISPRYPFVELLNAVIWLNAVTVLGYTLHTALICLLASALIVAAFIDHDTRIVPDRISLFIGILAVAGLFDGAPPSLLSRLIGLVSISVPMLLLACFTGGFGGADIKLSAACGLLLGWQAMLAAALFAACSGAVYGVGLLLRKKADKKAEIAFVPHLAAGIILSALYSGPVITWYLSLFGIG